MSKSIRKPVAEHLVTEGCGLSRVVLVGMLMALGIQMRGRVDTVICCSVEGLLILNCWIMLMGMPRGNGWTWQ